MPTAFINHSSSQQHDMGAGHPEQPARVAAIEDRLISAGILPLMQCHTARPANWEQIARAHDEQYLKKLQACIPQGKERVRVDPDTCVNAFTWDAAIHAAGAAVQAVELVLGGQCHSAFCNVRPPGHHAERSQAMGFCFFNNVAVAALHALEELGLDRVAIVDFDVHYGNGTADIFAEDERVLLCSSFQYPLYPLDLLPPGRSNQANIALAAGATGAELMQQAELIWLPALEQHRPQLLLFSAGFDAHREDPLAELNLVEADYANLTRMLMKATQASTQDRCVSVLEGGYDLDALGRSAAAHIEVLVHGAG